MIEKTFVKQELRKLTEERDKFLNINESKIYKDLRHSVWNLYTRKYFNTLLEDLKEYHEVNKTQEKWNIRKEERALKSIINTIENKKRGRL